MWPFTPKTLYDRYSKLIRLIMSIDSHFEITENQEDSVRLHLPNYKGNQTMDFHIYLMEPFLCINYVTEIDGEKISTVNSYPQDMDQQDMFNAVMASNLDRIHEVIEGTIQEENEENKGLNDEQLYALYYYAELCYYSCTKKGDAAHSTLFNLFLSRLNLSDEDILQLKAYHSSAKPEELYTALRSIDDKELFDIFISMCIVFVDDADTYITEKEFDDMLQAIGLTIDDVRSIMARRGLASIKHYYDRERTTAWDDVDEKDDGVNRWIDEEENKALRIINVWSLLEFAKAHGKMQVGEFCDKETGKVFKSCVFTQPDGTRTFVAFSTKLGELTPKQIVDMKNELQVVQLETGNYSLCKNNQGSDFDSR